MKNLFYSKIPCLPAKRSLQGLAVIAFGRSFLWSLVYAFWRGLRARPDRTLSNKRLGNIRSSFATQAICHGMTR
jgi:hypothetical protein